MDRSDLQPHFLKQQLLHAYGPEDLTKMQTAFDQLCRDEAVHLFGDTERDNLAKAIVTAYDSKMDERTLAAVALSLYTDLRQRRQKPAWREAQESAPLRTAEAK